MAETSLIVRTARRLELARQTGVAVAPVRHEIGIGDIATAYAVQAELTARRIAAGARVVGRKIGLTSLAVQQQLGVDQPDFGVLFDDMAFTTGDVVPVGALLSPKVEAEVAFVLARDLTGDISPETVRASIRYAVAALEIVDSRVSDWDITIVDTVADNGSSALFVLGSQEVPLDEVEPRNVEMSISVDGQEVSSGNGAACLGDPITALLWLARVAQDFGDPLREGQVVLSGALGPMVPIRAGQEVRAEISGLGSVTALFAAGVTA